MQMKKYIILLLVPVFMISCKSKAVAVQNNTNEVVEAKTDKKAIEKR
jgi:hypothetical protein